MNFELVLDKKKANLGMERARFIEGDVLKSNDYETVLRLDDGENRVNEIKLNRNATSWNRNDSRFDWEKNEILGWSWREVVDEQVFLNYGVYKFNGSLKDWNDFEVYI